MYKLLYFLKQQCVRRFKITPTNNGDKSKEAYTSCDYSKLQLIYFFLGLGYGF